MRKLQINNGYVLKDKVMKLFEETDRQFYFGRRRKNGGERKMGEIKFRAWSESKKAMYRVLGYSDIEQCFFVQGKGRGKAPLADIVLMQYTGLKDKNGKEIYVGDIVLCKIHDKEYMGLVEYTNTYGFYYLSGMGRSDTELWGCNERKVIGNIYENPELLKEEQELGRDGGTHLPSLLGGENPRNDHDTHSR